MEPNLELHQPEPAINSESNAEELLKKLEEVLKTRDLSCVNLLQSSELSPQDEVLRDACEVLRLAIQNEEEHGGSGGSSVSFQQGLLTSSEMLVFTARLPLWTIMDMGRGMKEFTANVPWRNEMELRLPQLIHPGDKKELESLAGDRAEGGQRR
ncbi:hypothetical protein GUITHDRAFT_112638 [Guillardia theta CCMP2712]|uniref:Uncharacterized protein n=1 Tax=Guillardia theta (strain CCMP2712) TaxID=905079 RepID=L1IYS8_GUITC|nr:hypothetical protein GUITHDRAFT_112638 [Guillardia theta CCMP2712]EKX41423.1 hypothetical protein GUITHDRAFT_112638 [Guillardia theta CCMP2712]|eukprot:XP_005828403.1 hypothetical protein GUITHDRAFT_112638 [Guillardia theta CCMP2712]